MVKKVTAPKSYDPGKGRPREHLAYLNEREMAYLRSINGNNMERGPKGLPSFPPDESIGSSSRAGGSRGPGGPSGPNSGPSRSTGGLGGGGKGSTTGGRGPGGPSGPNSAASGSRGPSQSTASTTGGYKGPSSPMGGQGTSFKSSPKTGGYKGPASPMSGQGTSFKSPSTYSDKSIQQKVQTASTQKAVKSVPAVRSDLSSGGIRTLNVGPMGTPVKVGGVKPQAITAAPSIAGPMAPIPRMNPLNDPAKFKLKNPEILQGVNPTALSKLTRLQEMIGKPLTITSGYRNPLLNKRVGGAQKSQHMSGNAIDIKIPGATAAETADAVRKASEVGFGGIGGYRPGSIHVDVASQRAWGPSYSGITIGGPMGSALKSHAAGRIAEVGPDYAAMERSLAKPYSPSRVASSDAVTGPVVSGNVPPKTGPKSSIVGGALNKFADAMKNPDDYQMSIPEAPALIKAVPDRIKQAAIYAEAKKFGETLPGRVSEGIRSIQEYTTPRVQTATTQMVNEYSGDTYGPKNVSPEVQEEMADIERTNRYGTNVMKAVPGVGMVTRGIDTVRGLITGKNTAEADADLKRAYMQADAAQRAELERRNPNLTKFAQQAGIEPQLPMSNYENWRQRSFGTGGAGGVSTTVVGSGGTPDFGSGGKFQYRPGPGGTPYSPPPTTTEKAERGRPQQYYNWDAGVGIPSPGDSDYTLYLKYLEEKAAARAAVS